MLMLYTRTCLNQLNLHDMLHAVRLCETDTSAEEVCTSLRVSPTLMSRIMETRQLYETPDTIFVSRKNMTYQENVRGRELVY